MMWNRYGIPVVIIGLSVAASGVSSQVAFAQRSRDYSPSEFRAVLRGFGYNVTPGNTLRDEATRTAIRQFQQGYKLQVDGVAGPVTQNFAANIVKILKSNLNLVLKPSPGLPINQVYDAQTEAAVKRFQEQVNLPVTGFANLQVRQRLDQEAKNVLGKPSPTPAPTPAPTPSPTPSPTPTPTPTPRATPTPAPTPTPRATPQTTPPSPSPSPSPSPLTSPSPSPLTSPSPQTSPPSSP